MKQLTTSFSTFLKLSSLSNLAVLGQLKNRLKDNGGYNYHRSMRRSVAGIQFGGMSLDEAKEIKNTTIVEYLALPPVKIHCSVLAEDAIKSAIKDYESKKLGKKVA